MGKKRATKRPPLTLESTEELTHRLFKVRTAFEALLHVMAGVREVRDDMTGTEASGLLLLVEGLAARGLEASKYKVNAAHDRWYASRGVTLPRRD